MRRLNVLPLWVCIIVLTGITPLLAQDEATKVVTLTETLTLTIPAHWEASVSGSTPDDVAGRLTEPESGFSITVEGRNILNECVQFEDPTWDPYSGPPPPLCDTGSMGMLYYLYYVASEESQAQQDIRSVENPTGDAAIFIDAEYGLMAAVLNLGDGDFLTLESWDSEHKLTEEYREEALRRILASVVYDPQYVVELSLPLITEMADCTWAIDTMAISSSAEPSYPVYLAVRGDHVYVYLDRIGILTFDENGSSQQLIASDRLLRSPVYDMVVLDDGSFLMATADVYLNQFDAAGNDMDGMSLSMSYDGYTQVDRDQAGNLYLLNIRSMYYSSDGMTGQSDRILVRSPEGDQIAEFEVEADTFQMGDGEPFLRDAIMGVSPDGRVYIAPDGFEEGVQPEIRVFDVSGDIVIAKFGSETTGVRSISFTDDGTVYLFNPDGVSVYTPGGELITSVPVDEFAGAGVTLEDGSVVVYKETGILCRMSLTDEAE
jgi:hypothetical protein